MDKAKNALSKQLVAKLFENEFLDGLNVERKEGYELIYSRVAKLVYILENTPESENQYTPQQFEGYPILFDKVIPAEEFEKVRLPARGRAHIKMSDDQLKKWLLILALEGFNTQYPIIMDEKGKVLDGWQRLIAAIILLADVRVIMYDMDSSQLA
ncbi:MAG: hypothetical protein V4714_14025 [Bacteroidota bacterium]